MVANRKVTGTASSMPAGLALGAVGSLISTVIGAGVFAYMISAEKIPAEAVGYCAMAVLLISSVLGPLIAAGRIKRRRLYVCAISGLIYFLLLLGITALLFGGQYQGMGVTALLVLAGAGTVAMLNPAKKTSHSSRYKMKHR